ncbi:hypothetical protein BKA60DRAFT_564733 [Fusarium oxysporum]|nr:hypothetical protein BKA60DRAFT_564733 [Fusarium oxysporum]
MAIYFSLLGQLCDISSALAHIDRRMTGARHCDSVRPYPSENTRPAAKRAGLSLSICVCASGETEVNVSDGQIIGWSVLTRIGAGARSCPIVEYGDLSTGFIRAEVETLRKLTIP